jgi:hypothetical protein
MLWKVALTHSLSKAYAEKVCRGIVYRVLACGEQGGWLTVYEGDR